MATLIALCAAANAPAGPIASTIPLGREFQLDLPGGWVRDASYGLFRARGGAVFIESFHPLTGKADALPYATLETMGFPARGATINEADQRMVADQLAAFYETSVAPPARSDAASAWKSARVTPVRFDAANRRFAFEATIHFADRPSDYQVRVAGAFGRQEIYVVTAWSDAATQAGDAQALQAVRDSFRLVNPGAVPRSLQDGLLHVARVGGLLLLIGIVAVQLYAVWRERRERIADDGA